jgi:hypothetical protein
VEREERRDGRIARTEKSRRKRETEVGGARPDDLITPEPD